MILTCPNCATDFFIDDLLIGADGRRVKCDECGEVWTAAGNSSAHATAISDQTEPATAAPAVLAPVPEEALAQTPLDAPMFAPARTPPPPHASQIPRRRLMIALLIGLVLVVLYFAFQKDIAKLPHIAEDAYRAVGLTHSTPQIPPHG